MEASLNRTRKLLQIGLGAGAITFGGGVCLALYLTATPPPRNSATEALPDVAVIAATPRVDTTPVVGHGAVRAKNQVDIVPLVSGRLMNVHRNLLPGKIIPKGEMLFEIDATVYEARVRQAEAEVQALEASILRIDEELKSLRERESNALEMLAIDERDLQTSRDLYERQKVGTQRDLDLVQQKYLRQKDTVTEIRSRIATTPHVRTETEAKLSAAPAQLGQSQHDLTNTRIGCPFKARVETVQAHTSQVVTAHFSIAKLTDMEAFEISVGIDPRELRWLDPAVRPEALEGDQGETGPPVRVSWSLHGQEFTWRGRVTRFERVDEVTRTARMVVEVRDVDMTASVTVGEQEFKTALSIGMYIRASLPVTELTDALLVPRHAIYDNRWVYVFEPDGDGERTGRLSRRAVPMLRASGDEVLVDYRARKGTEVCELRAGEQIVVSPLLKPVDGMRIRLREPDSFETRITSVTPRVLSEPLNILERLNAGAAISPVPGSGRGAS